MENAKVKLIAAVLSGVLFLIGTIVVLVTIIGGTYYELLLRILTGVFGIILVLVAFQLLLIPFGEVPPSPEDLERLYAQELNELKNYIETLRREMRNGTTGNTQVSRKERDSSADGSIQDGT